MKRRPTAIRQGWPPPELLVFDPADWLDDGGLPPRSETSDWPRSSPAVVRPLPPDLARQMRAWSRWRDAREAWEAANGDRWPTGSVERWVEERAARPGGPAAGVTR